MHHQKRNGPGFFKGKVIPEGLMTWPQFKRANEGKERKFIVEKERRTPTEDEIDFLVHLKFNKYLERNMQPKVVIKIK